MKHIFIINPVAGTGKAHGYFMPKILEELKKIDIKYKVHITTKVDDAKRFVRKLCYFRKDDEVLRFYACGGDGTLSEVVNGSYGYKNIEVACIPAGTGNDFVRNFDNCDFKNINLQINSPAEYIDLLKCNIDGKDIFGINVINMGIDAEATKYMNEAKRLKFLRGAGVYLYGVFRAITDMKSLTLNLKLSNGLEIKEEATLFAMGNGLAYGGGFKALPLAKVDDGLIDICLVKKISRAKLITLIDDYKKGKHIDMPSLNDIIKYDKVKEINVETSSRTDVVIDGELESFTKLNLSIIEKGIKFVIPKK